MEQVLMPAMEGCTERIGDSVATELLPIPTKLQLRNGSFLFMSSDFQNLWVVQAVANKQGADVAEQRCALSDRFHINAKNSLACSPMPTRSLSTITIDS
jgi:hypothetical protein